MDNTTAPNSSPTIMHLAVVGAHLSGFPLNKDLTTLNATLYQTTTTSPSYKLFSLRNISPPKPGLVRVATGQEGSRIEVEIWNLPLSKVGEFLCTIPSPLGLGSVELADGRWVKGFICEPYALEGARVVSEFGGWRKFREACG